MIICDGIYPYQRGAAGLLGLLVLAGYIYVFCSLVIVMVKLVKPKPQLHFESDFDKIDQMNGRQFEFWCAELLRKLDYKNVSVTRGSGDQGVDIVAVKDGIRHAFQCKRYSKDLGNKPVQEVYAGMAMYNCSVGVVITNRYFTTGAIQLAKRTGIVLINRSQLNDMIRQANDQTPGAAPDDIARARVDAMPPLEDRPDMKRTKDPSRITIKKVFIPRFCGL